MYAAYGTYLHRRGRKAHTSARALISFCILSPAGERRASLQVFKDASCLTFFHDTVIEYLHKRDGLRRMAQDIRRQSQ